ncbi:DUF305 domain-containing protein [Ilyomonas limi]|uniref:DUF305 domain-containing protein n=1 Tax=Ilyomonas limi TaxID=2575867 RepID=A0A4U3KWS7_9BACT|nr:DUF305 domain-containing protein [Ilyomonas limi]TKK66299.1 DUF305 domain-containing protein [Ilyomonas limi]
MKNILLLSILISSFTILSCTKEDGKLNLQSHDENETMASLHDMMNDVDTISFSNGLELDFISVMKVLHHGGNMSGALFHENKNNELMQIAENRFLNLHVLLYDSIDLSSITVYNSDSAFKAELTENLEVMSKVADTQLITGDVDNDYATLMIPHLQLIIATCNSYLNYGTDSSIRTIAHEIIDLENTEILELSNWLIDNKR